jgi:hypothetical protein
MKHECIEKTSWRASLFRDWSLNACSPFFASFCLFIDGCFLHFAGFGKASAKDFMGKLRTEKKTWFP